MSAEPALAPAAHAHDDDGAQSHLQHHFADLKVQSDAARLGMWLFLSTEILLFGGLFLAYSLFRETYPAGFHLASEKLSPEFGLVDTFILITSSMTMAMAIFMVQKGKKNVAVVLLLVTIGLGLTFVCVHGYEYWRDIEEGCIPGKWFHAEGLEHTHGAAMFFTLYFCMTGLHTIHVLIGAAVLGVLTYFTWKGEYTPGYLNPLENGGLYWHLIDLIWIFLYPLLYLIA